MRQGRVAALAVTLALGAGSAGALAQEPEPPPAPEHPWAERVADAKRFAAHRKGQVSFAILDETGELRGYRTGAHYESASVVKLMLMVAYLRRIGDRDLDDRDRGLLAPMIRRSANAPASEIYLEIGPGALHKLAREVGMPGFQTGPTWGSTRITAAGQARFLYELENYIPQRHRDYALGLMADIVSRQRWGIPHAVPPGWRIHFKGGWAPEAAGWKINQVALVTDGERRLALAVLTRGNPTKNHGEETIKGVAERLLAGYA